MNIALGALILVLLILPAISFRFGVNRSSELKELIATISITDSFWVFLTIPIIIHCFGIILVPMFFGEIRYNVLYELIIGNKDYVIHNSFFQTYVLQFLVYSLSCIAVGYGLGYAFAWLEDHLDNHRRSSLRFFSLSKFLGLQNNQWYSLLDGGEEPRDGQTGLVFVDILSQTKEATVIYSGILWKYYFKHNSKELGYIVLTAAFRRDMRDAQVSDIHAKRNIGYYSHEMGPSYKIAPGEYFVIPRESILNINVLYLTGPDNDAQSENS